VTVGGNTNIAMLPANGGQGKEGLKYDANPTTKDEASKQVDEENKAIRAQGVLPIKGEAAKTEDGPNLVKMPDGKVMPAVVDDAGKVMPGVNVGQNGNDQLMPAVKLDKDTKVAGE